MNATSVKCEASGCKADARWECTQTVGKRTTLRLCDQCKPNVDSRPAALRGLPFTWEVKPIR